MTARVPGRARLVGHDKALTGLLDALLSEVPASTDPPAETSRTANAQTEGARAKSGPLLNDTEVRPLRGVSRVPSVAERVVPGWSRAGFRVLLFRIGDHRFAMPLLLMRSICLVPDKLVKVPGKPDWQRGLVRYRGDLVQVADLGSLLGIKASCVAPRYLLIIGDGLCAFECDRIEDAIPVVSQDVRWSSRGEGRAWLAGLLADQMCTLLDADAIVQRIRHG